MDACMPELALFPAALAPALAPLALEGALPPPPELLLASLPEEGESEGTESVCLDDGRSSESSKSSGERAGVPGLLPLALLSPSEPPDDVDLLVSPGGSKGSGVMKRAWQPEPNRMVGFVGPFDAALRGGGGAELDEALRVLPAAAAARGVVMGRVVGGPTPAAIEENIVAALKAGYRLISAHYITSDLPFVGAAAVAAPFFAACKRLGLEPASRL